MNISEAFVRRPIMTVLVMSLAAVAGIVAFLRLPVSDLPVVDYPVITISVAYPGASPNTMASAVASPIENQCTQIPGLTRMISLNTEGQTQIILTFDLDRNVDLAAPDVQAAISRAAGDLPTDLPEPPTYSKTNPSDAPIIYLTITSDTLTPGQLYDLGNKTIGERISMIRGVSQVQVWGAKSAVRVQADPKKLAQYQIGINDIAAVIKTGTVLIPGGSLNGEMRTFSIEPQGQLFKAKDYDELIVTYRNNAPIRLKDIATCVDSVEVDVINVMYGRADEEMRSGTVVIAISRQAGSNTVVLSQTIQKIVEQLKQELPGSVTLDTLYDKSNHILESITDVKTTILISIFLVVLVIFLFLGRLSDTIIPAVALPISLIVTFAGMLFANFSLDTLSLMGIILAVGFVIDDAIVVLENNVRLIEEGMKPQEAAIKSAEEIGFTIVSMTLSLAIIFIPLIFMSGVIGKIFREFAITVVMTIMFSGIISLTLTPMMCARMLKEKAKKTKMETAVNNFIARIIKGYGVTLKWTLQRPWTTVVAWLACFFGTVWLFMVLPQTFIPEGDSGAIRGMMVGPLGISTAQMTKFQNEVNKVIQSNPNVDRLITVAGTQPGADQSNAMVFIRLKEGKRDELHTVMMQLKKELAKIPYGFVFLQAIPALNISTGGESTATGSKYSYMLTGADQDQVYKTSMELEQKMHTLNGYMDIQNSVKLTLPELDIDFFRDRASTLGITAQDIEYGLCLAYAGGKTTTYKTDIDQYKVIVELDKEYQTVPDDLYAIYLRPEMSRSVVPLGSVSEWKEAVGPQMVPHINQLNSATLSFNVRDDVPLGDATKALEETARQVLPPEVTGRFQGQAEQFKDAIASLGILIIIAIILKYVLLGVLYENYAHPFTVITTLPVGTFGGLLTLLIFGSELSLYAYIGVFMLLGIVAKNGIMMVEFATANIEKGNVSNFDAIYEACLVRFRPITMTGLAGIFGALPIALGYGADGSSRIPLGLVVVGGMVFSQIVTLYVTPGIFLYMQKFQENVLDRFELTRAGSTRKRAEAKAKSSSH